MARRPQRNPADEAEIKALLAGGMTRGAVSIRLGCGYSRVARIAEGRPARRAAPNRANRLPLSAEARAERLRLYEAGATDAKIGAAIGRSGSAIKSWRTKEGLPANGFAALGDDRDAALTAHYAAGLNDVQIGRLLGRHNTTVRSWRVSRGLPSQRGASVAAGLQAGIAGEGAILRLARTGMTVRDISQRVHACRTRVRRIMTSAGLSPPSRHRRAASGETYLVAYRDSLYARAAKAVGRGLSADVRDDAISDVLMAVYAGEIDDSEMESRAAKVVRRTIGQWASRFGPASLDEDRDGEGWTWLAMQADPHSTDAMRVAELSALAVRMGLDVRAILSDEA